MTMIARWRVVALSLALMLALGYGLLQGRRVSQLDAEIQRQRTERLEAAARADGWTTVWAKSVPDLLAEAAERDSMIARLREEARLAGAHPVARVVAQAVARVDTVIVADTVRPPPDADWARQWTFDGPVLYGPAWYIPPDSLGTGFRIRARGELIGTLTPDDRLLVTARGLDPGVEFQVETFEWTPPEPDPPGFPWLCAGVAFGSGGAVALEPRWWTAGAGALATLLAC